MISIKLQKIFRFTLGFLFISLLLLTSEIKGEIKTSEVKKIALVLSGGGAQGLAHIGVLKALRNIKFLLTSLSVQVPAL